MKQRLNPKEVCDLLGVTPHALHKWRSPQRLSQGRQDPLFLPAIPDQNDPRNVWYEADEVRAFIQRNEKYRERVWASFVPAEVMQFFLPSNIERIQ